MALGAQIVDVLKLVLRRAMLLALAGIGIGMTGAVAVTRYLSTLLFGVKPVDLITFAGVALVLAAVVFVACLVPARRAAKIDPLEALDDCQMPIADCQLVTFGAIAVLTNRQLAIGNWK